MKQNILIVDLLSTGSGGALKFAKEIVKHRRLFDFTLVFLATEDIAGILELNSQDLIFEKKYAGVGRLIHSGFIRRRIRKRYREYYVLNPYQVGFKYGADKLVSVLRNMEPFHFQKYEYTWLLYVRNMFLYTLTIRTFKSSDLVISISKCTQKFLKSLEIESRLIPHGFEISTDKLSDLKATKGTDILVVGSLLPYRRLEDVIEAIYVMRLRYGLSRKVSVIGNIGDRRYYLKLLALIGKRNLSDQVEFLFKLDYNDVLNYMRSASTFINPSEVEACPNIAIESLMLANEIISVEVEPLKEVYGRNVSYYEPRNVEALVQAMVNPKNNSKSNIPNWNWEDCMNRYNKILRNELFRK